MTPTLICVATSICAFITALPQFDHVKTRRIAMPQAQELLLQRDCEAMNAEGKIYVLLADLNRNAEELGRLRMERREDRDLARIQRIQENIHDIVTRAKSILRPEWTDIRWPYRAEWTLRFSDQMKIDKLILDSMFEFDNFELDGISLGGIEREDLYPLVNITTEPQAIRVEIQKDASSLELCQLLPTWVIDGTVKFRFQNDHFAQAAELTIRPGVIR